MFFFPSQFLSESQPVLCMASKNVYVCGFGIIHYLLLLIVLPSFLYPLSVWNGNSTTILFLLLFPACPLYLIQAASVNQSEARIREESLQLSGMIIWTKHFPLPL